MRKVCAAAIMLLSVDAASASELGAFFDRLARLTPSASLLAYKYFECAESAAKDAASRDNITPSRIMADLAATEAAKQCEAGSKAFAASAGHRQAKAIKALVHRANVKTALQVRRGGPKILCAVASHACSMKRVP